MTLQVLSLTGNEALGEALARQLGAESVAFQMHAFPDGETYLRILTDVANCDVMVVCTLLNPNPLFLPLAFVADTLRDLGAKRVGLIAPYLAYMRQDRRFEPGEALTSTSFADLLSRRFDWLLTVDPHLHRRKSLAEIYAIPAYVVHAAGAIAAWIRTHVSRPLIVGPDSESEQWVREVAEAVPCPFVVLDKVRRGDRDVSVSDVPDAGEWRERTPVLVDDIISSAGTMAETVRRCMAAGLSAPICIGVHGVFAEGGFELLRTSGAARIVTSNTIPHPSNGIDVSGALAAELARRVLPVPEGP
jgi:ribose-phosphate pyrophosphokinase